MSLPGGGMGDIIQCTDTHLDRHVILKILRTSEENRRLLDEQKALIKIRSKHVVQLYDVITVRDFSGTKTALVLEYISGTDLCPSSFRPDMNFQKTIWQIACGLADIHSEGIIHRDIKTNNIRVDDDQVVKILDFGLARSQGPEAQTVNIIGTLGYMAPELWGGPSISFDRAIDVYAFGVTALSLINQSIPTALKTQPPSEIDHGEIAVFLDGVTPDIIDVIAKCLSYKPADRPDMSEVEKTIRKHLLFNQHRALIVLGNQTHLINETSPRATVSVTSHGSVEIFYSGTNFTITNFSGQILVNNASVVIGDELPACCVITFGGQASRRFVTFDVSNPEVTA